VVYVDSESPGRAQAGLAGLVDVDRLLTDGALRLLSLRDVYGDSGEPVDPERVIEIYAAETEAAIADGFRGLRVSADLTERVRTPAQQDSIARYEFLLGSLTARHPLSALCAYRLELDGDTLDELTSLHTVGSSDETGFALFACADGAIGLAGQFDPPSVATLQRLLTRLRPAADAGTLVVDMGEVEHVDHRLLLTLNDYAQATGVALSLRSTPPFTRRLLTLLTPHRLRAALGADT
jgi:hypothetical protein